MLDAKIVWTCPNCKKECEESNFDIDIEWGRCDHIESLYINLQCMTCGHTVDYEKEIL